MVTPSYQAPPPYLMPARKLSFGEKVKGFLISPTDTFNNVKIDTLGDAVKYYIIWVVIHAVLSTIVIIAVERSTFEILWKMCRLNEASIVMLGATTLAMLIMLQFVGLFIGGAWIHLWVWIFGGRKGYGNTVKAFAYGDTPSLLLGWIPFVGGIFGLWALVLNIIGIRQLHEISTGRTIAALVVAIIIPVFITITLAVLLYVWVAGLIPSGM